MKIALLANLKENAPHIEGVKKEKWDDLDSHKTVESILDALRLWGNEADFFEASILPPYNLIEKLERYKPDMCFNIAEGHFGNSREAHIPGILEMMQLPYTGSRVLTLAVALDKPMTKRILHYHELPTPEFQVFGSVDDEINEDLAEGDQLRFPLFLKPSGEGTGIGVDAGSIVKTLKDLKERLEHMLKTYNQPILCERFIQGRELTVGIVGNLKPTAARRLNDRTAPHILPQDLTYFPPMEINTDMYEASEAGLYTNRVKVDLVEEFFYTCPAKIKAELVDLLYRYTAAVFRVTGCHDVARVDFRLDEQNDNSPYILEINPLPGLNPGYSDLCIEARAYGWSYEKLINTIVDLGAARYGLGETE